MAEYEQTGKRDETVNPQVQKEATFEAVQRDSARTQAAAEQAAAETGAYHEGIESMAGKAERVAGQAASGARDMVSGTLRSVGTVSDEVIGVARDVLKGAVAATEEVGSGLVGGVQHVATDVVHGVGEVGGTAVHTLTDLLVGIVGGVKTVVSEAMPRNMVGRAGGSEPVAGIVERKRGDVGTEASHTVRTEQVRVEETTVH